MAIDKHAVDTLLLMIGKRHTNLMEFWAELMNQTRGKIAGWLVLAGYKTLPELVKFLRPNQIAAMSEL